MSGIIADNAIRTYISMKDRDLIFWYRKAILPKDSYTILNETNRRIEKRYSELSRLDRKRYG